LVHPGSQPAVKAGQATRRQETGFSQLIQG
jgi:hypothetical protein